MTKHIPLNVLDLVSISEGQTKKEALEEALEAAQLVDKLGFKRLWFAEHHNSINLASMATSNLIGLAANVTKRIRVGSGGIMLPNHSPLQVAESFGTIAQLFPDRIDLGLGRAPGTDAQTAQLLTHSGSDPQSFANSILDLTGWFSEEGLGHSVPVTSNVGTGTNVPMWVLGSSMNGASIAGQLGLPYSIASHFTPDNYEEKIDLYRSTFKSTAPTAQIEEPYVMAGINVLVAPTDEEAERLWTTTQNMLLDMQTGKQRLMQPPVDPDELGTEQERARMESMFSIKAVGSPETVRKKLEEFTERSGADELIVVTYTYDPEDRKRSMKMLADLWF
ncbi:luciferase family oxidoreductase group 1 [Virgibacillus natechei]|uniref:Luciferase family oxidoreductase group 1 n=1 Tax=Virgibacillus natechei TaxID=1216297 RepID=A0ABS4IFX2_9BACI|nr:LLM class flavin-dependent oxidoreductase [Virgibacillus natechei]MBP1969847.1 luciferase family oxidoreductase group 1 [Virgibacillus natechei]UZD12621.1 LLM class flavin-dependent oxidoreductase [Virgibacillus natechei]